MSSALAPTATVAERNHFGPAEKYLSLLLVFVLLVIAGWKWAHSTGAQDLAIKDNVQRVSNAFEVYGKKHHFWPGTRDQAEEAVREFSDAPLPIVSFGPEAPTPYLGLIWVQKLDANEYRIVGYLNNNQTYEIRPKFNDD